MNPSSSSSAYIIQRVQLNGFFWSNFIKSPTLFRYTCVGGCIWVWGDCILVSLSVLSSLGDRWCGVDGRAIEPSTDDDEVIGKVYYRIPHCTHFPQPHPLLILCYYPSTVSAFTAVVVVVAELGPVSVLYGGFRSDIILDRIHRNSAVAAPMPLVVVGIILGQGGDCGVGQEYSILGPIKRTINGDNRIAFNCFNLFCA